MCNLTIFCMFSFIFYRQNLIPILKKDQLADKNCSRQRLVLPVGVSLNFSSEDGKGPNLKTVVFFFEYEMTDTVEEPCRPDRLDLLY
jgi:hypothetical protein